MRVNASFDINAEDEGVMNSIALDLGWPPVLADDLRLGETIHSKKDPHSEQAHTLLRPEVFIIGTDKYDVIS
jgi:hypothetical protein